MPTLTTLFGASPLNADDANYLTFTVDLTETLALDLDNVNSDFGNMLTLTWLVQASMTGTGGDDTYQLNIRIVNGATILAAEDNAGTFQQVAANVRTVGTTDTNYGTTAFNYVNTTADKATWDGASIELQQSYVQNMAKDVLAIRVDIVTINGTYTAAAAYVPKRLAATGVG